MKITGLKDQLEKQIKQMAKDAESHLTIYEMFSKDFMVANHINFTIEELFEKAKVDISNFKKLSNDEKKKLDEYIPKTKFNSWDEFLHAAGKYQVVKKLQSKGYGIK